jgi:hypothetical protein
VYSCRAVRFKRRIGQLKGGNAREVLVSGFRDNAAIAPYCIGEARAWRSERALLGGARGTVARRRSIIIQRKASSRCRGIWWKTLRCRAIVGIVAADWSAVGSLKRPSNGLDLFLAELINASHHQHWLLPCFPAMDLKFVPCNPDI